MDHRLAASTAAAAIAIALFAQGTKAAYAPAGVVRDFVDVTDYLPVGEPTIAHHDNSAGFQLAATTNCARFSNGGRIFVPAVATADYYVAHDITNTCGNVWEGDGQSGIGAANQTSTSAIQLGGTAIDYSAAASFFMAWIVPGFPSFPSGGHLNGGGIHGFTLRDGASSAWALVSEGTQDWKESNLIINGAFNGTYMKGDEFPAASHISMYGTKNLNYQIEGDLTGQTASGGACSTSNGDCSTRSDAWFADYLTNIDNLNTNTVFQITGFVATPTITHSSGEGPRNGFYISCPPGLNANLGQCPSFGRFEDNQIENFSNYGAYVTDFLNMYFDHGYFVGIGGGGLATTQPNFYAGSVNYTSSSIPVGRLQVVNSEMFATAGDCVALVGTMWDVNFINDEINGCNSNSGTAYAINASGTLTHLKVIGSTLGTVDDFGGVSTITNGVNVSSTSSQVIITDNFCSNIVSGNGCVATTSTFGETFHIDGNVGPGGVPSLGTCGSGSAVAGTDDIASIQVAGAPTSCTMDFAAARAFVPNCMVSPEPGSVTALTVAATKTTVTVSAGSSLNGTYSLLCKGP